MKNPGILPPAGTSTLHFSGGRALGVSRILSSNEEQCLRYGQKSFDRQRVIHLPGGGGEGIQSHYSYSLSFGSELS